jgi:ParB family chromosome partitioning protein
MSVREVERAIQQTKNLDSGSRKAVAPKRIDPNLKAAEDRLRRRYGTQVKIISNAKQGGKIELDYYDENDLDRVYTILMGKSDAADVAGA